MSMNPKSKHRRENIRKLNGKKKKKMKNPF
jgi:hypothetical protein